jgi:hypothetical protein
MFRPAVILFSCLLLCGCNSQERHPEPFGPRIRFHATGLVKGEVSVNFQDGTSLADARKLISDLGLSFKSGPGGPLMMGMVVVPVDSEDQWVKKLLTYPIVRGAGRLVQSVPDDPPELKDTIRPPLHLPRDRSI